MSKQIRCTHSTFRVVKTSARFFPGSPPAIVPDFLTWCRRRTFSSETVPAFAISVLSRIQLAAATGRPLRCPDTSGLAAEVSANCIFTAINQHEHPAAPCKNFQPPHPELWCPPSGEAQAIRHSRAESNPRIEAQLNGVLEVPEDALAG